MEEPIAQSLVSDCFTNPSNEEQFPKFSEIVCKLWELADEILGLTIERYVANKDRYAGVVREAERMGLDVGTFRDRLSALDTVVLLERESQRKTATRQNAMDRLKERLAELEAEGSRERREMSLVRLDLMTSVLSPWNSIGGKQADVSIGGEQADEGEGEEEEDWDFVKI